MKEFLRVLAGVVVVFLIVGMVGVAFGDNGTSVGNKTYTLLSSSQIATGATVTATAVTFDNPMNSLACDVVMSNATATGTFQIEGNVGTSATSFTSANLLSASTVTANQLNTYFVTGKPTRTFRVIYKNVVGNGGVAAASSTITTNCMGVQ